MSHIYEAFVDIKEYATSAGLNSRIYSERYEIPGDSRHTVEAAALEKAENIHPKASEFDVRITRLLH
jgi:hypothetical protein